MTDALAREEPLELRLGERPIAVIMRTPGCDLDLALGFLVTEGAIEALSDVAALEVPEPNAVSVRLAPGVPVELASLERSLFAGSSCGICGKASVARALRRVEPLPLGDAIPARVLLGLPDAMRAAQPGFERTGGLHAAALFDREGGLLAAAEDVGRHNAVDKVVGAALRSGLRASILLVSGRASFEIVQKAAHARIPVLCAVSAPSSLAADTAEVARITLVGFLRAGGFSAYACASRLIGGL